MVDFNSNACASEDEFHSAWVLTTKRVGDTVAGWQIQRLEEDNIRYLEQSERCEVTSFCYPTGAKVVRAYLQRPEE